MARFIGMHISGAYGDTLMTQTKIKQRFFGRGKRGQAWRWVRSKPTLSKRKVHICNYSQDEVAYKQSVSRALYKDMSDMAQKVLSLIFQDPQQVKSRMKDCGLNIGHFIEKLQIIYLMYISLT